MLFLLKAPIAQSSAIQNEYQPQLKPIYNEILEKILVAQDFGKSSDNVVKSAIELAKIFQSTIVLIHILPDDIVNEKAKSLLNDTALTKLIQTRDLIKNEG